MRGHDAIGIEGSDYSKKCNRAEWRLLSGRNLFTADITKPFVVSPPPPHPTGGETAPFQAHVISAWEVMEHIKEYDLPQLLNNVKEHLVQGGIFIGSIATFDDYENNVHWHSTIKPKEWWENTFSKLGLPFVTDHLFEFEDFCRGSGNGYYDWNAFTHPEMGFHFVARKGD
jgi:hypothetical protein